MKRTRARRAGRLFAEFGVIVLGVLVALAADRWNQDRMDRELAVDYSARLLAELTADSLRLEAHSREAMERALSGLALLEVVRSNVADSTARVLYFRCARTALPHPGGATFTEIQNTGSLRLLPPEVRQTLFDYYGYVDGLLARLEAVRSEERRAMTRAANRSGALLQDVIPESEFSERLRAYPDIEGIVLGCVGFQRGEAGLADQWVNRLGLVLEILRANQIRGGAV